MVTTGFSRIHVAKYTCESGKATYTGCRELARARSMDTDIEVTDENKFYANNALAETDPAKFKSGKAKLKVDGLSAEEEAFIMGIEETTMELSGTEIPVLEFGENMEAPYLGIGAVKRMQMNGVVSYRAIIFTKARFTIPADAAETQEEEKKWQDQELEATLMRDDTDKKNWKIIPKVNFDTENMAVAFIEMVLGGKAESSSETT